MKYISILLVVLVCGCAPPKNTTRDKLKELADSVTKCAEDAKKIKEFMLRDPVMSDTVAVSNATYFHKTPADWSIVCDKIGHYAVKFDPNGNVFDEIPDFVRTNEFEAIVAAWQYEGIRREPRKRIKRNWTDCEATK